MFQPLTEEYDQEFKVTVSFYREYLEELFDIPEPRGPMVRWDDYTRFGRNRHWRNCSASTPGCFARGFFEMRFK